MAERVVPGAEWVRWRAAVAARARHSIEMEGGSVSAEAQADVARYVAGEIDSAEVDALGDARLAWETAAGAGG